MYYKANPFEQRLIARIAPHIPAASPGLQLQVHRHGHKVCDLSLGDTYPYYDLASLTKIVFTVPALMLAFEKGLWTFETTVGDLWPGFPAPRTKLTALLTHSSGALWWYPFYKEMDLGSSPDARRAYLWQKIQALEWKPGEASVYSDIGMLVLGFCLEAMLNKPLTGIWDDLKSVMYPGLNSLAFHPGNRAPYPQSLYAPTEACAWRGRRLQGEVHDENAWALGGVSSHAGLFGGISDVSGFGLCLRSWLLGTSSALSPQTAKYFTTRATPAGNGDWALGFMMPSAANSSCGDYFSGSSIGHTGFTGTSIWYDPDADLLVTILSNRVFFGREREDFKKLRPLIHDWVVKELR